MANALFFNHRQCCCAGSRLFAHEKVCDKVLEGVADIASKIKLGRGLDPATEMGPIRPLFLSGDDSFPAAIVGS